jgi:type III pantothenate kinase
MILLIDIGNTRIKWAHFQTKLSNLGSTTYKKENLLQLLNSFWKSFPRPTAVYIANVGSPDLEPTITNWVTQNWQSPTHIIKSSASAGGVTNGYTNPTQLGVDRWLAILAAHHSFTGNVCVFDCGTAMTMDLVNAAGVYQGGLIFPGLSLMQTSLIKNTAACSITESNKLTIENQLVAKDTQNAILLGSLQAALSIIKNQTERFHKEFHLQPTFIITGGDAETLLPHLPPTFKYIPSLVLQGLSLLTKNNK